MKELDPLLTDGEKALLVVRYSRLSKNQMSIINPFLVSVKVQFTEMDFSNGEIRIEMVGDRVYMDSMCRRLGASKDTDGGQYTVGETGEW